MPTKKTEKRELPRPCGTGLGSATVDYTDAEFKDGIQSLGLGKGSWLHVDYLPPKLNKWLRAYCKRAGIQLRVSEPHKRSYNVLFTTREMDEADKKEREERVRADDDYYNSPG